MLGNGPHMLGTGNRPHMLGNEPHVLGKSTFGILSHLGLLYVASGILLQSGSCPIREYVIRDYVFSFMVHSGLCHIWGFVVRDYIIWTYDAFGLLLHSDFCRSR